MEQTVQNLTRHVQNRTTQQRPISVSLIKTKNSHEENQNNLIQY